MAAIARFPHGKLRARQLACAYMTAKENVIRLGFAGEIDWQDCVSFNDVTESAFLREAAWVILSAGMRESIVRNKFPALSAAFLDWGRVKEILTFKRQCRRRAMAIFANERKIDSILRMAEEIDRIGFSEVRRLLQEEGIAYISRLPYMGPATTFHLAKNLGLPVVKPDRHLVRVARKTGFPTPEALCSAIAQVVGDKLAVIDLVIWRYATLNRNYLNLFAF